MKSVIFIIASFFQCFITIAQGNESSTKGTEFWLGFMKNYDPANGKELSVFITSEVNTTGTLSIPAAGYTDNFTVQANQTTQVDIDDLIAEHIASEAIENKGILIETQDDVSVFAINFLQYTADGMKVLPTPTLGTEYRVMAHQGYGDNENDGSMFLVVATEDSSEITITPTINTQGGRLANVPFTIWLNRGQSYQVIGASETDDFTGTVVSSKDAAVNCKPFAVFSGASCPYIPLNCLACDHITDQNIPVDTWGRKYHVVPWDGLSTYTLKVLAEQDNTTFKLNGTTHQLNAGEYYTEHGLRSNVYVSADKVISVAQFMEGAACNGGTGDPAMVILNADNQKIDQVTFSTVNSNVINDHYLNIITKTSNTNGVTVDGNVVTGFEPFEFDSTFSFTTKYVGQGSHTIASTEEFIAYAYGVGSYETYAYSVGSKITPTRFDTVICSTDTVGLEAPDYFNDVWWTNDAVQPDTLTLGRNYNAYTEESITFLANGINPLNGCEVTYSYQINTPKGVDVSLDSCFVEPNIITIDDDRVNVNFTWFDEDLNILLQNENTYKVKEGGVYYIRSDFGGYCEYWDTVDVQKEELNLIIPNIFTPNGDNLNESFELNDYTCIQEFQLKLYNRWGKLIYEDTDPNFKWDGDELNDGVYFYSIEINPASETPRLLKGWVQISR